MPNVFAEDDPYAGKMDDASARADKGMWGSIKSDAGEAWDSTYGKALDYLKGPQIGMTSPVSYDWGQYNQGNAQQQALNEMLLARARGQGPSVAENQLAQATDANRRAALGQAMSARGGAMQQQAAQRQAQAQGVQAQQQSAGQAATMRAQEQQAAMGQYQNALQAQQQAELMRQLQMGQQQLGYMGQETARFGAKREAQQGGLGQIASMAMLGGSLMSDERAKTNVAPAGSQIADFLGHLAAKRYEYRDGFGEPGTHTGVMAQDMERSPVGREFVSEDPSGMKRVDTTRMPMMLLAALAEQQKRIDALEGKGGRNG